MQQHDPMSLLQPAGDEDSLRKFLMSSLVDKKWLIGLILHLEREFKPDLRTPFATDGRKLYYGPNWHKFSLYERMLSLGHICLHLMCEHFRVPKIVLDHMQVYGPIIADLWGLACDIVADYWLPQLDIVWGVWSISDSLDVNKLGRSINAHLNISMNNTALKNYQVIFDFLQSALLPNTGCSDKRSFYKQQLQKLYKYVEDKTGTHLVSENRQAFEQACNKIFSDAETSPEQLDRMILDLLYCVFGRTKNPPDEHLFIKRDFSITEQEVHANSISLIADQIREQTKRCGKLPAYLVEYIDSLHTGKISWTEVISQYLSLERGDVSWRQLNKRYLWRKLYLPGVDRSMRLDVYAAVDTSGSMTEEEIRQSISEIYNICSIFDHFRITVLQCDAALVSVQEFDELTPSDEIADRLKKIKGRGGTSYWPVFRYIWQQMDEGVEPRLLIYFTDLCVYDNEYPQDPPSFPVIWVRTGSKRMCTPPYGVVVDLR